MTKEFMGDLYGNAVKDMVKDESGANSSGISNIEEKTVAR